MDFGQGHFAPGDTLAFHHIGIACRSVDREAAAYTVAGYAAEGDDFVDPIQGIQGRFLGGAGPRLELLTPTPGSDVLDPWLAKGVKMYHLGFEAVDFESEIERLQGERAKIVRPPVPAVAFGGRRICFLMMPNLALLELIEV